MVRELLFEGANRCFDQTICTGLKVTESEIMELCRMMKAEAIKNVQNKEQKESIKDVGKQQLLSWGILTEKEGQIYPTNAYAILMGKDVLPIAIQCGVFKGETRATFIDRREYTGPLWKQVELAYQFVLRNIHMGATFEGLYRQDIYEIPPDAIRELIINAVVHRSYLERGNIQIAIYDDRLEVTSPGKLPMGQTLTRMKEGYSKIKNDPNDLNWDRIDHKKNVESRLLEIIRNHPELTYRMLAEQLLVSTSTVKRILTKLQREGAVTREGSNRKGRWIAIEISEKSGKRKKTVSDLRVD